LKDLIRKWDMLRSKTLSRIKNIRHSFFTRRNGKSTGVFSSLNCGLNSGDYYRDVFINRSLCANKLGVSPENLVTLKQAHNNKVIKVDKVWKPEESPQGDGLITNNHAIAICVLTADCVPILIADKKNNIIGAVHAGWKGTVKGIIENTIEAMINLGADSNSMGAAVGPCIGKTSYEVTEEYKDFFLKEDKKNICYFKDCSISKKIFFDLGNYVIERINKTGIKSVERMIFDTYKEKDMFFSYRRSIHQKESNYGRQLSGIAITK